MSDSQRSLDEAKRKLRAEMRDRLRALGPISEEDSRRAQQRLLASSRLDRCRCVAIYLALPSEISTGLLESTLRARGVLVCVPRIASGQSIDPRLEFCAADGARVKSPLGFEQPHPECAAISLAQIDAFVLPARAADLHGNRLGRGRGHYDATLAAHPRALRVGLLREAALVPSIPIDAHDQPLDALCTEARFIDCSPRSQRAAR